MRKILLVLLLFGMIIALANISQAAPARWGIAINSETKECAGYWAGDEFSRYILPSGWESFYPDYEKGSIIETDFGECNFTRYDEEQCCKSLGLTFVSSNIGKGGISNYGLQRIFLNPVGFVILVFLAIILFFAIRYFLKRKR
ncbi:MAG: hypothetical protein WD876_01660 [Candidatus Pacearchaeota archaeon]